MSITKCFLIGGAPLTGKSTLASTIAANEGAVQISTDNIRHWMKQVTNRTDHPNLFYNDGLDAEAFYRRFNIPEAVLLGEIHQGKEVEQGVSALLRTYLPWEELIIEGIAITPEFVVELKGQFPRIHFEAIFLYDDDSERIKDRIYSRGLWDLADTYPDYLKPKEVEWVILYNEFYKQEAKKFGFNLTHVN